MKKFSLSGQNQPKRANRINTSATQTPQTDERDTLLLLSENILQRQMLKTQRHKEFICEDRFLHLYSMKGLFVKFYRNEAKGA